MSLWCLSSFLPPFPISSRGVWFLFSNNGTEAPLPCGSSLSSLDCMLPFAFDHALPFFCPLSLADWLAAGNWLPINQHSCWQPPSIPLACNYPLLACLYTTAKVSVQRQLTSLLGEHLHLSYRLCCPGYSYTRCPWAVSFANDSTCTSFLVILSLPHPSLFFSLLPGTVGHLCLDHSYLNLLNTSYIVGAQ